MTLPLMINISLQGLKNASEKNYTEKCLLKVFLTEDEVLMG